MALPSIQIQTVDAQTGLRANRPPVQIKQRQADLDIRQKHVDMIKISKTAAKLHIDQTEAFADANLKSPLRMANEFISKAKNSMLQYIAKTAQEGEQMMRIENGGEPFQALAAENSMPAERETTLVFMPRSMSQVKISYTPSEIKLDAPYEQLHIRVTPNKPQITIPKWQTDVYMKQKNSITFQYKGTNVNKTY